MNEMKENMGNRKMSPMRIAAFVSVGIALVFALAAVCIYTDPTAKAEREVSRANAFMNEGRFDEAGQAYERALATDASCEEALKGQMQLAYETGDIGGLRAAYTKWCALQGAESPLAAEMEAALLDAEYEACLKEVTALMEDEDYAAAEALLQGMPEELRTEELVFLQKDLLVYLADELWKQGKTEEGLELLFLAEELVPGDERLRNELAGLAQSKLEYDLQHQNYDEVYALADRCSISFGRDVFEEYRDMSEIKKAADDKLQFYMRRLAVMIQNDEKEQLMELLHSDAFLMRARGIRDRLFQNELLQNGVAEGKGVAIYNIDNCPYIYYGGFEDGKREGEAVWLYSPAEDKLNCYDLIFREDIPEGAGICECCSTVTKKDREGNVTGSYTALEIDSFTLQEGVMDGSYHMMSKVEGDHPYEYSIDYQLLDGYCKPRMDYPEELQAYMNYPVPLAGWTEAEVYDPAWRQNYTTTIWKNWSPKRWGVDGIILLPAKTEPVQKELYRE